MQRPYLKIVLAVVWVFAVAVLGYAVGPQSLSAWVAFVALAVLPPLVTLYFWKAPPESLSESIQKALH
jgi:drug/metabolite transporter (DMT)-like permease